MAETSPTTSPAAKPSAAKTADRPKDAPGSLEKPSKEQEDNIVARAQPAEEQERALAKGVPPGTIAPEGHELDYEVASETTESGYLKLGKAEHNDVKFSRDVLANGTDEERSAELDKRVPPLPPGVDLDSSAEKLGDWPQHEGRRPAVMPADQQKAA